MARQPKRRLRRRRFRRVPRLKGQTVNRMIPNFITICALAAGLTAVRYAIVGEWKYAVIAILTAGVLDALDGRMARLLKSASEFGAQLDSLSDVIAFGVAPAFVVYLWALQGSGDYGWVATLFFTVCCALRLARFNITELPPYAYNYFTGMPAPAGACMCIFPMVLSFQFGSGVVDQPWVVGIWMVLVAGCMVSRLPTFAFKGLKVPHGFVLPVLAGAGLVVAALATKPWLTLSIVAVAYLATIPFAFTTFRRLEAEATRLQEEEADSEDGGEKPVPLREVKGPDA
ncbi:MAG: CDP-diacylglycerol--serine O-phosphatidyltransferase [Rhodospirillaceae bacterium]|nr:CDP-diacylglycerol--serine O-phosphatidyltransferase [Rhodospirillaceae bacterium]